jgi:cytochrome c oxidase assembly protein subunit 15
MSEQLQSRYERQMAYWLFVCALVIIAMILLGGITRLTHSGLSMVEWKPLIGVIPPLSEAAWQAMFAKYQQFPEYQLVNAGMSLSEFKSIFLFEYAHRVLGRLIGLLFLLPFLFFYFTGRIKRGLTPKLLLIFFLGGLQGLLGWYMVKSGLVDNPRVSQYRLTAHLGAAVLIYAAILWVALGLYHKTAESRDCSMSTGLRRFSYSISGLVFLMILTGGLVAGTRAGLAYNNWPWMGETLIPPGLYATNPWWMAIFEDITTIQFNHRMLAYLLCLLITLFTVLMLRSGVQGRLRVAVGCLLSLLLLQVSLGIATLWFLVPVPLAAAHQGGAILLFTSALVVSQALYRGAQKSALIVQDAN